MCILCAAAIYIPAPCPAAESTGTVEGTVSLHLATIRSEGPKHDRDVVVILSGVPPGGQAASGARATMDQRSLVFIPHVLAIQRGTTVTFLNNDNDLHNIYFLNDETGETLDIGTWGQGVSVDHTFREAGTVITLCNLHLEMAAYIVVIDSPWFTTVQLDPSTRNAEFRLENVPAGKYRLFVWHKKLKQKGGAVEITVPPGGSVDAEIVITKAKYASGKN